MNLSSWIQTALDFLFPAECAYCHHFAGDDRILIFCKSCWESIPRIGPSVCPRCGKPYRSTSVLRHTPDFLCGDCRVSPPFFDRVFSASPYDSVVKEAIHQFKFHQKPGMGKPLAQLLMARLPDNIDWTRGYIILPVPLHKTRQRQRGYNQSTILATHLARRYHLKPMYNNLIRIRATKAQWPIKKYHQRKQNVKNAFRLRFPERITGQHLIVIDDIFTTGATVNECSRILKEAGARSVLVFTLSRAGLATGV